MIVTAAVGRRSASLAKRAVLETVAPRTKLTVWISGVSVITVGIPYQVAGAGPCVAGGSIRGAVSAACRRGWLVCVVVEHIA